MCTKLNNVLPGGVFTRTTKFAVARWVNKPHMSAKVQGQVLFSLSVTPVEKEDEELW